jgi:radical SAM superfamily enzyme YgiQ (UPF0313 family)
VTLAFEQRRLLVTSTKKALLIYPEFALNGFWNYRDVCRLVGAKYPSSPLGMITLAALLPQHWEIKLINMNTARLHDSDVDWADLVFIGGMLPQQVSFLRLIDRVHSRGKKVVVGGPDPTSQPEIYSEADYLVLGEAEQTIKPFIEDLESGVESGVYRSQNGKPDITKSPVPRFDLLDFDDYLMIDMQFSRGCPFDCEFCDIIELFGRVVRTKTPEQIVEELNTLYELGYRGHIFFVDDNFIGHKRSAKRTLRAIRDWSKARSYPYYFSTEATINLADDDELLGLMKDVDFRYVFIGIESADERALRSTKKSQNLNRKLYDDLHKIYRHGITVNGGFIIGFDNETSGTARQILEIVDYGKICMAMIGLLYALPNTQLTRRLIRENRFFEGSNLMDEKKKGLIDQTTTGLNFVTQRPRDEIIGDFIYLLKKAYSPKSYFDKSLKLGLALKTDRKFKPSFKKLRRTVQALFKLFIRLGMRPSTSCYFWRNIFAIMIINPSSFEDVFNLMAMYIHFAKQSQFTIDLMTSELNQTENQIDTEKELLPINMR